MFTPTTTARVAEPPIAQLDPKVTALSDAYNRFGFGLFRQITKVGSSENVFVSPASAAFALAMLYNGAAGTTREELAHVLGGLGELTLEEEGEANSELLEALGKDDTSVQLAVANSIWYRNSFTFREDFLERSRESFTAEVAALNFDDPGSPAIINAWVKSARGQPINSGEKARSNPVARPVRKFGSAASIASQNSAVASARTRHWAICAAARVLPKMSQASAQKAGNPGNVLPPKCGL
jgi:hypothetical protein